MDHVVLDEQIRVHTGGRMGLMEVLDGYLGEVRQAASVLGVEFDRAHSDPERACIELVVSGAPEVPVEWTPFLGWSFWSGGRGVWRKYYRVGSESDAASMVPEAENVAAWLRVLADGDRDGHEDSPEPLDARDEALVSRLTTFGAGSDPHSPGRPP